MAHWLLVAWTVKVLCVPAVFAAGVPEITPVPERLRPDGRVPDFSTQDQVPPLTPVALNVCLYGSVAVGLLRLSV